MVTVTKVFRFEASHKLPDYVGKCHKLHGHSYKLEVTVTGSITPTGSKSGMIVDFNDLKDIVNKEVIGKYDHSYLNDFFPNPTAEIMVSHIGRTLIKALNVFNYNTTKDLKLVVVKLWETDSSYAEYIPFDEETPLDEEEY